MIKIIDISTELKKLTPVLGKDSATRLEKAYLLGDEETKKRILEMMDALKATVFSDKDLKDSVLMEPPSKEITMKGDIELGTVLYGKKRLYPLLLDKNILLTHIGIFGSSGYGKTNIIHYLTQTLADNDIPVIIFDFSKRNYRDLLSIPEFKDRISLYTVGRDVCPFKFNPLAPPEGIQISQWAKEFSEIFDHSYWLLGGGRHIILKALEVLYRKYKPGYPKIQDLNEWVTNYELHGASARERNWVATAERPLKSLCFMETGKIFDCDKGISPSSLFEKGKITILELDSLSVNDKTFFIEIVLQWIRDWLLAEGSKEVLKGMIVIEEAHHILNREKSKKMGAETVIDLIFREIRELGMGIVYADQHPSLISYPALGNTSTHIYMNLGLDTKHSSDILDASNMLGLDYKEEGSYLRKLPVGHTFMLCRRLGFPYPFLVEFPLVKLNKGSITDKKLMETMKISPVIDEKKPIEKKDVDSKCLNIIEVLGKGVSASTSESYRALGVSGKTFNQRLEEVRGLGLVGSANARVYKQNSIYHFLTDSGKQLFFERFGKQDIVKDKSKLDDIVQFFTLNGWTYNEDKEQLIFKKDERIIYVKIETALDRESIEEHIRNSDKSNIYYVCASKEIKNMVIQSAAKVAFENEVEICLFITTIDEVDRGKNFKEIQIIKT